MSKTSSVNKSASGWQYYVGWFLFILSFLMPFSTAFVPMLGLSNTTSALIIGVLLVGAPELVMMLAIALWGKTTFDYFMGQIYKLLKRFAPAATVSPARYYLGLVLFIISFFPSWILAYAPELVGNHCRIAIVLGFDILFVISFFILGGDFWEKIRALFIPGPINVTKTV